MRVLNFLMASILYYAGKTENCFEESRCISGNKGEIINKSSCGQKSVSRVQQKSYFVKTSHWFLFINCYAKTFSFSYKNSGAKSALFI